MIERNDYLKKLIASKQNGMVKIITGIRRCGKSVLLFDLYYRYLLSVGVKKEQILTFQLDDIKQVKYRNPFALCDMVDSVVANKPNEQFFLFIDEVQYTEKVKVKGTQSEVGIYEMLNSLNAYRNVDVYVTGSNSKMLSSDIATEFRGRGDEIRVHPLSFGEYYASLETPEEKAAAWNNYVTFGGMPQLLSLDSREKKFEYLKSLLANVYLKDITERNELKKSELVVGELLDCVASSVGSQISVKKLSDTFLSVTQTKLMHETVSRYLNCFEDAFLISKAKRYDIKGKAYIDCPVKYYFEDIGLRNARLGFREQEAPHIMENIIYNELVRRGYNVDIGSLERFTKDSSGKSCRSHLEIDFVCNKGSERYYIQSAYAIPDNEKREQEIRGLIQVKDSFQKIVIMREPIVPWKDENGILYIGIEEFLLRPTTAL